VTLYFHILSTFANLLCHLEHEERDLIRFLLEGKVVIFSGWNNIRGVIQSNKHPMDDLFGMAFSKYGIDHRKMKRTCRRIETNSKLNKRVQTLCEWSHNTPEQVDKIPFLSCGSLLSANRFLITDSFSPRMKNNFGEKHIISGNEVSFGRNANSNIKRQANQDNSSSRTETNLFYGTFHRSFYQI
jgi:hypothetical protein